MRGEGQNGRVQCFSRRRWRKMRKKNECDYTKSLLISRKTAIFQVADAASFSCQFSHNVSRDGTKKPFILQPNFDLL